MMSFNEMQTAYQTARIIITHGGPSSFLEALQYGKVPIVVPRQVEFNEHINNHQVDFVKLIDKKMNNIIPVYDIQNLESTIIKYDSFFKQKNEKENSNNKQFNQRFESIIEGLFKYK